MSEAEDGFRPVSAPPADRQSLERMIRVDHAGEYGARHIYAGQLAVLGRGSHGDTLRHMQAQEQHHLDTFSNLVIERRVRPTVLLPVWRVAGFAAEELEHRDIGLAHDAEQAPFYRLMSSAIRQGCKAAIRISEMV